MKEIKPALTQQKGPRTDSLAFGEPQEILCIEEPGCPAAMIVFGASGDLVHRKLLPSLFELYRKDLLSDNFYFMGVGRKKLTDEKFRQSAEQAIHSSTGTAAPNKIPTFLAKLYFVSGDYEDSASYQKIKGRLEELDKKYRVNGRHIFYLAVPQTLYGSIVDQLGLSGLARSEEKNGNDKVSLIVEKPFGNDLRSAIELNNTVRRWFDESQIYRIDHYLGKETVQNILIFRFANTIFEPVWNRNYIDSVQITIAEKLGVGHRAGFYDKTGALRDVFQNHMLQMLALVAKEPPISFEPDRLRDEKAKLLRAVRPFDINNLKNCIIRGQYSPGTIDGKKVQGYRNEPGVNHESKTETFVAARVFIDNWRWKDVPFYLRTGKRLSRQKTEIAVTFKKIPHSMFYTSHIADISPNVLVIQIQPEEGISLSFQAKRPGSKICMSTLDMNFNYKDIFGVVMPEAYQRLLLDAMLGDQTLFTRYDTAEIAWELLTPVLKIWEKDKTTPAPYPAGSESFPQADKLIGNDGRKWRELNRIKS